MGLSTLLSRYIRYFQLYFFCSYTCLENIFEKERYDSALRTTLPEICNPAIDYRVEEPDEGYIDITDLPIYIMVVDATKLCMI